ncbi:MAG TPA: metal-dependent transcriptional regulator [Candidatus Avilachnospira avistercoris]|nr:metal-dependent transcriptional regulator [Candidatus Avilachnospira avistercoris]
MSIKKNPESVEMYLETILKLSQKKPEVHSIDIANEMGFSKPSVSVAMKNLREEELITMDELNHIHLTDKGKKIAETILERHSVLTALFKNLGVDPKIAEEDACRIEHFISDETFSAIKRHASEKLNGQF